MEMIAAAKRRCALPLRQRNVQTQSFIPSYSRTKSNIPLADLAVALAEWEEAATGGPAAVAAEILRSLEWTERKYWSKYPAKPAAGCLRFPASRRSKKSMRRL